MKLPDNKRQKLSALENWFKSRQGSIVAFSGGIDSTLVLYLARKFQGKDKAIGVISNSESLKTRDFDLAKDFCRTFDIHLEIIKTRELEDVRYAQNPANRCFYCKEHLFRDIEAIAAKNSGFDVLSGANYDDLGDFRPGMDAARKFEVLSPLIDCKVSKRELREIAHYFGLPNWDKPASPCLSSRIPYDHGVTAEKLRQIEAAEEVLYKAGFSDMRVRHYGPLARIEVQPEELEKLFARKNDIIAAIKALGFEKCEIDSEGLVSGKMNRALTEK